VESVGIGDLRIPTQRDGSVFIHFSRSDASRFVPAARVMSGAVAPATFEKKLVLIGVTAVGLSDYRGTPVAERMVGVEIHAQLLECIFDGDLLFRPVWSALAEGGWLAVTGMFLVLLVPQWGVRKSTTLLLGLIGPTIGLGVLLYLCCQMLLDAALPTLGLAGLFTTMVGVTLAEADSQRRALRSEVERQREVALRLAGELEAARRIQMGILPDPAVTFADERRLQFYAFLDPAREVGGDLYDFFPLDDERVFVLIGDVSGKGLPGSLFMAVSKTLCKSSALRHAGDVGAMMREANAEIARDNGEGLFVTAWAGVVNARTGELQYVNAGHEPPYLVSSASGLPAKRLTDGGGPPFCVEDGFPYEGLSYHLQPGEVLCLITDGVTEALNAAGEFYGRRRLEDLLNCLAAGADPDAVGEAIKLDVSRFTIGVEPSDDVAILTFRWNGVT
jgi:serine phosphatase RsbU (regulator of sigma subunit)